MKPNRKIELFSETALTILVSVVTLLLQLISFATTWSGSQIYLEGVFPYASLLFAVAIQATAYFFSNSLREKVTVLKVVAMCVAMCCSTYYSYIGIYNSVNSPARFLQERYVQIEEELTGIYDAGLEENVGIAREAVGDAASEVTARYTMLSGKRENMEACREALAQEGESYAEEMRAPQVYAYENYEDYVAAYSAYIAGISEGSNTESAATRSGILASYGFGSLEALQEAEAENAASLSALTAALGVTSAEDDVVLGKISDLSVKVSAAIDEAMLGQDFNNADHTNLTRLMQAAKLCGYEQVSVAEISNIVKSAAEITGEPLMADYTGLVASLEEGRITAANTMDLKNAMDSEILTALLKMNSVLATEEQIDFSDERYQITDLYLIPISALRDTSTQMTAVFCLGVAALIDMLSVLFAISLRKRKPLWKRQSLMFSNLEDYAPQIYASLPPVLHPVQALAEFLSYFAPSPETEYDGYMMRGDMANMSGYYSLVAVLCQLNLAKVVPEELVKPDTAKTLEVPGGQEVLLLKARFVFWANSVICEEKSARICEEM